MARRDPVYQCPFEIVIDTREQRPFEFDGLLTTADKGCRPILVHCRTATLTVGDYGIFGYPNIAIERKSEQDFIGSIVHRRENFIERLTKMSELEYACVLVETQWPNIANSPFLGRANFKSIYRTVLAWDQRFPVKWWFAASRFTAEQTCFRMLERYWLDKKRAARELAKAAGLPVGKAKHEPLPGQMSFLDQ